MQNQTIHDVIRHGLCVKRPVAGCLHRLMRPRSATTEQRECRLADVGRKLGKVSKKYWEEEWENIIPNYVHTLHTGFLDAYKEVEEERRQEAASQGKELSENDLKINRFDLSQDQKNKIWKRAIAASWGTVDILDFEARWKLYITKGIR